MKKDKSTLPILVATLYLIVYIIFLYGESTLRIAFFMFAFSPVVIVWMVVSVLKRGKPGNRRFENYFYEDTEF